MIGLVQVGTQSMADRYTYVPLIGIFVIVAWGAEALRERLRLAPGVAAALGVLLLAVLGGLARRQVLVWKDTRTLFEHANAVTGGSSLANVGLGSVEFREGNLEAADEDFRAARRYFPVTALPAMNQGMLAAVRGHPEEAERAYREAIALAPKLPDPYVNLGLLYLHHGHPQQAVLCFEEALLLAPEYPRVREYLERARQQLPEEPRSSQIPSAPGP